MSIIAAFAVPHPPILLPEIGLGKEKEIDKTQYAYLEVMRRVAALRPETIVIASPHTVMYADYFHISPGKSAKGDLGQFRAGYVKFNAEYDADFAEILSRNADLEGILAGPLGERDKSLDHGTMVPLYYLNKFYSDYKLVRIGLSGLSQLEHYKFGQCIAATAEELGKRVVFIASGDLSHKLKEDGPYGLAPEGSEFDAQIIEALEKGDFLSILDISPDLADAAAECGLRSFQIMVGVLDKKAVTHELFSYEGPFGVGYAVAAFEVIGSDEKRNIGEQFSVLVRSRLDKLKSSEDDYVRLARLSLETYVKTGKKASLPEGLPHEMLNKRAGTFVSLKKHGQLRGCIGTISATTNSIAEEIMQNAVSAAVSDPRFQQVTEEELPELVYSVDVLGDAEKIASPDQLDVKRYGVIVESGGRRGLLLPNLESVDTVLEQISIAKKKAGIGQNEEVELFRFEVVRHK